MLQRCFGTLIGKYLHRIVLSLSVKPPWTTSELMHHTRGVLRPTRLQTTRARTHSVRASIHLPERSGVLLSSLNQVYPNAESARVPFAFKDLMIRSSCNSHYLSHFAAFFIVAGTKRSTVKRLWILVFRGAPKVGARFVGC